MIFFLKEDISLIKNIWLGLETGDKWLFICINRFWTNSFFDSVIPIWRESITWVPLYFFLLLFSVLNFGWKSWPWICVFIITVTVCDQVSSAFLKDFIGRTRPCRDPNFSQYVRLLLNRCPVSGSFTSSHATNHFGMAIFISITFKEFIGKWKYVVYFWAASVAYGQVYVGVHYPLDVIGGALLGAMIGWLTASLYKNYFALLTPEDTIEETRARMQAFKKSL